MAKPREWILFENYTGKVESTYMHNIKSVFRQKYSEVSCVTEIVYSPAKYLAKTTDPTYAKA